MPALESPKAFSRTFRIDSSPAELILMIAEAKGQATSANTILSIGDLHVAAIDAPSDSKLQINDEGNIVFRIPPHDSPLVFKIVLSTGEKLNLEQCAKPVDLSTLTHGGSAQYAQT